MNLEKLIDELVEEKELAQDIDRALYRKGYLTGLTETECKMRRLAAMVIQTHQAVVDHLEEL